MPTEPRPLDERALRAFSPAYAGRGPNSQQPVTGQPAQTDYFGHMGLIGPLQERVNRVNADLANPNLDTLKRDKIRLGLDALMNGAEARGLVRKLVRKVGDSYVPTLWTYIPKYRRELIQDIENTLAELSY